jgi:hypothetical protein
MRNFFSQTKWHYEISLVLRNNCDTVSLHSLPDFHSVIAYVTFVCGSSPMIRYLALTTSFILAAPSVRYAALNVHRRRPTYNVRVQLASSWIRIPSYNISYHFALYLQVVSAHIHTDHHPARCDVSLKKRQFKTQLKKNLHHIQAP